MSIFTPSKIFLNKLNGWSRNDKYLPEKYWSPYSPSRSVESPCSPSSCVCVVCTGDRPWNEDSSLVRWAVSGEVCLLLSGSESFIFSSKSLGGPLGPLLTLNNWRATWCQSRCVRLSWRWPSPSQPANLAHRRCSCSLCIHNRGHYSHADRMQTGNTTRTYSFHAMTSNYVIVFTYVCGGIVGIHKQKFSNQKGERNVYSSGQW